MLQTEFSFSWQKWIIPRAIPGNTRVIEVLVQRKGKKMEILKYMSITRTDLIYWHGYPILPLGAGFKQSTIILSRIFRCVFASLYEGMSVRPFVRPTVRPSVRPSARLFIRPSVGHTRVFDRN